MGTSTPEFPHPNQGLCLPSLEGPMHIPAMVGIGHGGDWVGGILEQDVVIAVLTPDEPQWEVTVITVTPINRIVVFSVPHLQCLKLLSFHSLVTLSRSGGSLVTAMFKMGEQSVDGRGHLCFIS